MPETPPFYVWPMADERTLTIAMLLLCGLFAGAVALELHRRRRERGLRLDAEWRAVQELAEDRELPGEDWALLQAIIRQYAPGAPYRAVTARKSFDECVAQYIAALQATAPPGELAARGAQLHHIRMQLGLDYVPIGQRIHSTRELREGQVIWAARATGHDPQWISSAVADLDEAFLRLAPARGEALPDYAPGEMLKFRFWRDEDARYVFDAPLHAVVEGPAWAVAHVRDLKRIQARAHFRIRFEQPVHAAVISAPLDEDYTGLEHRQAVTHVRGKLTSLSGGGVAIVFEQPVPAQVLLRLSLDLPPHEEHLVVFVRPVGAQHLPGGRSLLRGRFIALAEESREIITRYVFLKQKQRPRDEFAG